jgi:hypothetical protein
MKLALLQAMTSSELLQKTEWLHLQDWCSGLEATHDFSDLPQLRCLQKTFAICA